MRIAREGSCRPGRFVAASRHANGEAALDECRQTVEAAFVGRCASPRIGAIENLHCRIRNASSRHAVGDRPR